MKTVDVVKMAKGYYVTRRYCSMNKGSEFFSIIPPSELGKRAAKKWLDEKKQAMDDYINTWVGA